MWGVKSGMAELEVKLRMLTTWFDHLVGDWISGEFG